MIAPIVMWLALVGGQTQPKTQDCYTSLGGNLICGGYFGNKSPQPEHVIEIRTKRRTDGWSGWPIACDPQDTFELVNTGTLDLWYRCIRVTKTLWIDGVRVGVIREVEEK